MNFFSSIAIYLPGDIVKNISEFEDFGVYFFGPAYVYDLSRYDRFRRLHTPDLIESDFESEARMVRNWL